MVDKGRVHHTRMVMLNLNTQEDGRVTEGNGGRLRAASPLNSIPSTQSTQSTEHGRVTEGNGGRLLAASRRHFSATGIGTRPLNVARAGAAVRLGKRDEVAGLGGEGRGALTRHTRRQQTCEKQLEAASEASSSSTKLMSSDGLASQPPAAPYAAPAAARVADANAVQAASANSVVCSDGAAGREEGGLQDASNGSGDASNGSGGAGCQGGGGKDKVSERDLRQAQIRAGCLGGGEKDKAPLPPFFLTPSLPPSLPSPTGSSNKRPGASSSRTSKSRGTSNGGQVPGHTDAASLSHPLLNDE